MSNAIDLSILDGQDTPATQVFKLVAKDKGYNRWELPSASGKLSEAVRLAIKHTEPVDRQDVTQFSNRVIVTQPQFDADGLSVKPNTCDIKFSMNNGATAADRKDLIAYVTNCLSAALIHDQIALGDQIV